MAPVSKYIKIYQVLVNDVDFTKKLKPSAAFNYFQEIASLHSDNLGIGFNTIEKEQGVVWVLIRMRVEMLRYPVWNEEIILETWPIIPKRFHFERDFFMKDLKDNIIAKAISMWVIIDVKTRELRNSETIAIDYPEIIPKRAIESNLGKIKPVGERKIAYKRIIGCSDIDMNGHLNNSKYIDFIMDCFTIDDLRKYQANSIQVCYINEALPGEEITFYKYSNASKPGEIHNGKIYVEGVNEKANSQKFISEIEIDLC